MKKLYLVRHAKSSWDDPDMNDFDRPLNERGEKDAPHMAKLLRQRQVFPDRMISSPALRAITTCRAFAKALDFEKQKIETIDRLYHATASTWYNVLQSLKEHKGDGEDVVLVFGHNPGITEFANEILDSHIDNIPTCGIVSATLSIERWSEISSACGKLNSFDYPRKGD
ncbi:MAG TPA: histidine phosphatase family protein [Cyclobacteriaceae bacterium]|jgi:phosphohistidine phosphatase|nr:histidine phosphatase family protein [Cyclobacteriaceae bacterium]